MNMFLVFGCLFSWIPLHHCDLQIREISPQIQTPHLQQINLPLIHNWKYHQEYWHQVPIKQLQISSKLYVKEGMVQESDIYETSKYSFVNQQYHKQNDGNIQLYSTSFQHFLISNFEIFSHSRKETDMMLGQGFYLDVTMGSSIEYLPSANNKNLPYIQVIGYLFIPVYSNNAASSTNKIRIKKCQICMRHAHKGAQNKYNMFHQNHNLQRQDILQNLKKRLTIQSMGDLRIDVNDQMDQIQFIQLIRGLQYLAVQNTLLILTNKNVYMHAVQVSKTKNINSTNQMAKMLTFQTNIDISSVGLLSPSLAQQWAAYNSKQFEQVKYDFYVQHGSDLDIYALHLHMHQKEFIQYQYSVFQQMRKAFQMSSILISALFDQQTQIFYCTTTNHKLIVFRLKTPNEDSLSELPLIYSVNGTCKLTDQSHQVLHAVCSYPQAKSVITYGLQLYKGSGSVAINRFYSDYNVQGILDIQKWGQHKMLIRGQSQYLIQGYAVNRKCLSPKSQPYCTLNSAEQLIDIIVIDSLSTKYVTTYITIHAKSIVFHSVVQRPPEIYFNFESNSSELYSFLIKFNTTKCQECAKSKKILKPGKQQMYYEIAIPMIVQNKQTIIDTKAGNTVTASIFALLTTCFFIVICCGNAMRNKLNSQLKEIQNQIQKQRIAKEDSEMRIKQTHQINHTESANEP